MIELLARWCIPDRDNVTSPSVRRAYGTLCGIVGIALNILLFAGKFFAGQLSGSIAVTADAFNNLSDAGSSAVTLLGFRLAGRKPDTDHPFGHGRIEYISGLAVAGLILLMGVELAKSSVDKILHPEEVTFSLLALGILAASVCVKLYMWLYNRRIGKKIKSAAMEATAMDSLSDTAATAAVLLAMLVGRWTGLAVDGYVGLVVALFILASACKAAKETLSPLLGQPPDPALVQEIRDIVMAHSTVQGIHDLVVHDYGPGRCMISLHAEVPAHGDIMEMQDVIDKMHMPEICITYGQTEASPATTMSKITDPLEVRVNTVGGAIFGVECKIVDPETGEELPDNTDGEFVARGYNIMKGYYKMPTATAAAIDEEGWLHSGDLARRDENGRFKITGRIKDMIIRGGENIYPKEIEEFIYTHPKVRDVQVIGVPSKAYGEEIMACVILKEGESMTEQEVKDYVLSHMAKHKVPRYVEFVTEFPMNAAGKILKYKMREAAVEKLSLQADSAIETA